jgi:phosphatidate cytidylyltransferase
MHTQNPFANPLLVPSIQIAGALFVFGLCVAVFFARRDLKTGLAGELGKRLIGWLLITPPFFVAVFGGGIVRAILLLLFIYRLSNEYVRVVGVEQPYALYLYVLIPVTLLTAAVVPSLYFALPAGAILLLTLVPILGRRAKDLYGQVSYAGRGYLYVTWTMGHIILLEQVAGVGLVLLTGVSVALSDAMQFVVGKLIGRHTISPEVNPHKAWEGLIGDLIGANAGVALFSFALPAPFGLPEKIALAVLIAFGAAWGDLISSLVKREAQVKDWGNLIPGHGGLLDRMNSLVVVVPLVYYFSYLVLEVRK